MKMHILLALTGASAYRLNNQEKLYIAMEGNDISMAKDDKYFEESYQNDKENKEITEVKLTKK